MSKIDIVVVGNGTATVSNYDPLDGEAVTLTCTPDSGETIIDIEAWDSTSHSIALGLVPVQTFTWSDAWVAMTIQVQFSNVTLPKIHIIVNGDGTAYVSDDRPNTGDTVTLTCVPDPRRRLKSITAVDENGNPVPMLQQNIQTFTWNYMSMIITVDFEKRSLHRMPIYEYPLLSEKRLYYQDE